MSLPLAHRAIGAAAVTAAALAVGVTSPASAAPVPVTRSEATEVAPLAPGARLSAATPIGSVAIARISLTDDVVEVPTSVEAWPDLDSVTSVLFRNPAVEDFAGVGLLEQRAVGSTTWRGETVIVTEGIPLGRYTLSALAYRDAPGTERDVEAYKDVAVTVKSGSRVALGTSRSGRSVTLSADVDYYNANRQAWLAYAGVRVSFQTRLANGTWSQFATGTTDARGIARAVGQAVTPRVWRAVVVDSPLIWTSNSRSVTR